MSDDPFAGIQLLSADEVLRMRRAVGSDQPLLIFLGEWLTHFGVLSDAQIYDVLRFAKERVIAVDTANDKTFAALLVLMDYRWVGISGKHAYWDVERMEEVATLPVFPVTYVTCDIMVLCDHMLHRERNLRVFDPASPVE